MHGSNPLNPMCVNPGMMPFMMGMTQEQKNQYLRYQGYLYGKFLAQQKKLANPTQSSSPSPVIINGPAVGVLNIKFNKRGNIINIKLNANEMVAVLLDEYFRKTGTKNGNFKFNGNILSPFDSSTLAEADLKNNSEIIFS